MHWPGLVFFLRRSCPPFRTVDNGKRQRWVRANAPEGELPRRAGAGFVRQPLQIPLTWFGCAVFFRPRRAPAPTLTLALRRELLFP